MGSMREQTEIGRQKANSGAEIGIKFGAEYGINRIMNINRDIQTLSAFKQKASKLVKQIQKTKQPMVLTVNGKPAAVVQDPDSFQQLVDSREYRETITILRQRLVDIDNSDNWPTHKEVSDQIREKYNIERD